MFLLVAERLAGRDRIHFRDYPAILSPCQAPVGRLSNVFFLFFGGGGIVAELTLGLDLGPNSIGWVLVDEAGQSTLAAGVRVFPEGVDRDQQGGEKSKRRPVEMHAA